MAWPGQAMRRPAMASLVRVVTSALSRSKSSLSRPRTPTRACPAGLAPVCGIAGAAQGSGAVAAPAGAWQERQYARSDAGVRNEQAGSGEKIGSAAR